MSSRETGSWESSSMRLGCRASGSLPRSSTISSSESLLPRFSMASRMWGGITPRSKSRSSVWSKCLSVICRIKDSSVLKQELLFPHAFDPVSEGGGLFEFELRCGLLHRLFKKPDLPLDGGFLQCKIQSLLRLH